MNDQTSESNPHTNPGVNPVPDISSAAGSQDDVSDASELVADYKPLVFKIARIIYKRLPAESTIQFDDLTQAGYVGLLDAASKFQGSHGASFATYAHVRVNGSIIDEIRRGDWTPRSVYKQIRATEQARHEIEMNNGRQATDREIASRLSISASRFQNIKKDQHGTKLYLAQQLEGRPHESEHNDPFIDTVAGPQMDPLDLVSDQAARTALDRSFDTLTKREANVLMLYYTKNLTLRQVGEIHSITESRVSQIVKRSINILRTRMSDHACSPGRT